MVYSTYSGEWSDRMSDFEWDVAKNKVNQAWRGLRACPTGIPRPVARDCRRPWPQRRRTALLLFRPCRGRRYDGALHMAKRENQDIRSRLLAEGKGDL